MLKIKLARFGKRNQPHYRIVVNEAKSKRDGKYTASIGHYAPTQTPKILEIDIAAFKEWTAKGAQPTDTVASLVERVESGNPFPEKKARPSKKARAKAAAEVEAKHRQLKKQKLQQQLQQSKQHQAKKSLQQQSPLKQLPNLQKKKQPNQSQI